MKDFMKFIFPAIFFITILVVTAAVDAVDVETLLRDGKTTIEKGELNN